MISIKSELPPEGGIQNSSQAGSIFPLELFQLTIFGNLRERLLTKNCLPA